MVCGVDLIPGMLKAGKNKAEEKGFGNRVNLVVGDARFMPFREQAFDAAISLAVLEHIPLNVEKVFDEILRVLKPGGKAIVNTWSLATCLRNRRKKNAGYFCNDNFYKYYSTRELRSLVQARGFVRHKVYGHRFALMSGILRRLRVPAWRELSLGIERNTRRYVPALSTLLGQCLMVRLEK
jgi:ubiquinone/menaquinone biosynthesis C-methylase UbiE